MMKTNNNDYIDVYKSSRILYVIEAALEYFISILVEGAFLARVTSELGLSDSLTGILSAFVSLGCTFQLVVLFINNGKPVKKWVSFGHTVNQLCFGLIYLTPFFKIPSNTKSFLFVVFLLFGHLLNNIVNSPKINWFMRLVDDKKRGSFTAIKEIISLIGGMIFSFSLGNIMDRCDEIGNTKATFIICAVCIFSLTFLHSLTLLLSKEKEHVTSEIKQIGFNDKINSVKSLITDKNLLKIILVSVLWYAFRYASYPFLGSYQIKELAFSMTFVSVLSIIYAVVRSIFSVPLGKFADRHSFCIMMILCFSVEAAGNIVLAFTTPEYGHITFTFYKILDAVAMAGLNSGSINLLFDYVNEEKRTEALALQHSVAGLTGFLSTLAASVLITFIQDINNSFLGTKIYAQQVSALITFFGIIIILIYLIFVIRKMRIPVKETISK